MKMCATLVSVVCGSLLLTGCTESTSKHASGQPRTSASGSRISSTPLTSTPATTAPASAAVTSAAVASTAKLNPCRILTPADVHTQFGGTATANLQSSASGPTCTFRLTGSVLGAGADILVLVDKTKSLAAVKQSAAILEPVAVGDGAYYDDTIDDQPALVFGKAGSVIEIDLGQDTLTDQLTIPANMKTRMVALANAMANRV